MSGEVIDAPEQQAPTQLQRLGLWRGLSNADYHADVDAIGSSGLRRLARSPLHFFGTTLDPDRPQPKSNDAMDAGTLAHCVLLEPGTLAERYVQVPEDAPRKPTSAQRAAKKPAQATIDSIEWWDRFEAANAGRTIITPEQIRTARRQAAAIRGLPEIGPLLDSGEPEVSAFWTDEATGVRCKCRPDLVTPAGNEGCVLLDVKTTQDASRRQFARSIFTYRYDLQAAFYIDGYERASGVMVLGLVFAAVESEWPHAAAAYMIDDEAMAKARLEIRALLDRYAECRREQRWPGYPDKITPISLPAWAQ